MINNWIRNLKLNTNEPSLIKFINEHKPTNQVSYLLTIAKNQDGSICATYQGQHYIDFLNFEPKELEQCE